MHFAIVTHSPCRQAFLAGLAQKPSFTALFLIPLSSRFCVTAKPLVDAVDALADAVADLARTDAHATAGGAHALQVDARAPGGGRGNRVQH